MVFSSPVFLFLFLPLVITLYYLTPRTLKNSMLLLASLFFYAWGEGFFVGVMLVSIAANYVTGLALNKHRGKATAKWALGIGVGFNLILLGSYKYANFFVDNLNWLLQNFSLSPIALSPVHLPIGISFFTFQAISYIIDVYRNDAEVQKDPQNVALYIAMFPQLIAGPIVRYHDISKQIIERHVRAADFAYGSRRFVIGLGKKMLIANPMGLVADQIFALPAGELTSSLAWLGVICYALQIYFDFSAYSDMAIGLGRLFGFRFLENFNYPYISQSIQEFWRRWHISLSSWFRDYLYIPLGGNRVAPWRIYLNLAIVFFLCGLWHGASWNFVIWGLLHGGFLVLERLGLVSLIDAIWRPLRHAYVLLVVLIGWVFFRAEDMPSALNYLQVMFGIGSGDPELHHLSMYLHLDGLLTLLIGLIASAPIIPALKKWWKHYRDSHPNSWLGDNPVVHAMEFSITVLALTGIWVLSVMLLASGTHNPFIYFRF